MSFNGSHTIYNLGNQSLDLVLTTEGIKTDNRPMNQNKLNKEKINFLDINIFKKVIKALPKASTNFPTT